jgi:hypothetical protein
MVVKDLKKGTTLSIGTSSYSKWISNEKSEKLLGFEFDQNLMEFHLGIFNLGDTWTRDLYLHLVTNSIHGEEFRVQTRNFLT